MNYKKMPNMQINQTTLIEIEDYIEHLDETIGLKPETLLDIKSVISKYRKKINSICSEFIPRTDYSSGICEKCGIKYTEHC